MRITRPRIGVFLFLAVILSQFPSFIAHVRYHLSGDATVITGNWALVSINIALFLGVILFLRYRRPINWQETTGHGVYAAFIISLFVEMYGIPLTLFLGQGLVAGPSTPPDTLFTIPVLGSTLAVNLWVVVGAAVSLAGMAAVAVGWYQVYAADGFRTTGLYAYSRHPQYAGIIAVVVGWVIGWPTLLTAITAPIVGAAHLMLARREEADMVDRYGARYTTYREKVPFLL